jgi:hypothetical protein
MRTKAFNNGQKRCDCRHGGGHQHVAQQLFQVRDHTPVALLWCLALMGMGRNILGGTYRPGKRFRLFGFGMKPTILRGPEIVNVVIVICCC